MRFAALAPYLALPLALACAPRVVTTPAPPPVPGAEIRYSTRPETTHFIRARLVSIDADSLVVERIVMDPAGRWGDRAAGSLATDSIASLQVRVRRGGNAGRACAFRNCSMRPRSSTSAASGSRIACASKVNASAAASAADPAGSLALWAFLRPR